MPVRSIRADAFGVPTPIQAKVPKSEPVVQKVVSAKVSAKQQVEGLKKSCSNCFYDS